MPENSFTLFTRESYTKHLHKQKVTRHINLIQNHHTFIPNYSHFMGDNHQRLLESMERAHLERGFSSIAQNLTTFPDGTIAACRPLDVIPAGIKGANSTGICIEHVGNFDKGGDAMSDEHRATIVYLNALLCAKFSLSPNEQSIVYHHWYDLTTGKRTDGAGNTKSCPGLNFFGGNAVADAKVSFIPRLAGELDTMTTTAPVAGDVIQGTVTAASLNVRSGPGGSFPIVKKLLKGTVVRIYQTKNSWHRIHTGKQWVSAQFIEQ